MSLGDYVAKQTFLQSMNADEEGLHLGITGLASQMLANAFAGQFVGSGATNFLELSFEHPEAGRFTVTMQKVSGKTPGQLKAEAEAKASKLVEFAQSFEFLCDEGFVLLRMPNLACGAKYTLALGGTNDKLLLDGIRHLEELRLAGLKAAGVE